MGKKRPQAHKSIDIIFLPRGTTPLEPLAIDSPFYQLLEDLGQGILGMPAREVGSDLGEIGDVADMVPEAVGFLVRPAEAVAHVFEDVDRLQDRDAVGSAAAQVIDLPAARILMEGQEQPGDVAAMDLVPDLLTPVAVHHVGDSVHSA